MVNNKYQQIRLSSVCPWIRASEIAPPTIFIINSSRHLRQCRGGVVCLGGPHHPLNKGQPNAGVLEASLKGFSHCNAARIRSDPFLSFIYVASSGLCGHPPRVICPETRAKNLHQPLAHKHKPSRQTSSIIFCSHWTCSVPFCHVVDLQFHPVFRGLSLSLAIYLSITVGVLSRSTLYTKPGSVHDQEEKARPAGRSAVAVVIVCHTIIIFKLR